MAFSCFLFYNKLFCIFYKEVIETLLVFKK